jgi:hypothetical protein
VGRPVSKEQLVLPQFLPVTQNRCVGQVRMIFSLAESLAQVLAERLAFVAWFSKFTFLGATTGCTK